MRFCIRKKRKPLRVKPTRPEGPLGNFPAYMRVYVLDRAKTKEEFLCDPMCTHSLSGLKYERSNMAIYWSIIEEWREKYSPVKKLVFVLQNSPFRKV